MKLTYKLQVLQVKSPGTSLAGFSSECLTRLKSRCLQVMFSSGVLSLFQARSVCGQNSVLYRYRIKSVSLIYCQERCIFIFTQFMRNSMISLETFSMTHRLLRSVLFGCQMFGNFPVLSVIYLYYYFTVVGEHMLYISAFYIRFVEFF